MFGFHYFTFGKGKQELLAKKFLDQFDHINFFKRKKNTNYEIVNMKSKAK
jgi:hypothetical protein